MSFAGKSGSAIKWWCRCDCGTESEVFAGNLRGGTSASCGCVQTRHGLADTPEYKIWQAMKSRCLNPGCEDYDGYGGRGINVCDRWVESFENFISDIGPRPSTRHSLDRENNESDYEPNNWRWVTWDIQNSNRRNTRYVIYRGEKMGLAQAVRLAGSAISIGGAAHRIEIGWSVSAALETPPTVVKP